MKKFGLVVPCCLLVIISFPQTINQKLQKAFRLFETDSQLKHAITSLYIIDANSSSVVFDKNSQIGLAPASTQKIITSVTAFELLGKDYRYRTELGLVGKKDDDPLGGHLILIGNGDPTFGSWRWESTKPEGILHEFTNAINESGIGVSENSYDFGIKHYETQNIPDGWIWQDLGNYYGAGASALNWRENQFDIVLASGNRPGDSVRVVSCKPRITGFQVSSEARSAAKGSGDNTFVYLPIGGNQIIVRGTIPINEKKFSISATFPNPGIQFMSDLNDSLTARQIGFGFKEPGNISLVNGKEIKTNPLFKIIYTHYSPSIDSIIYWFNKKSINLYGEALIKTFAYEKQGFGSTDSGVAIVKKFWKEKGLDEGELNIGDGSGLSPQTRVTTHAEVEILKYARSKSWFPYFSNSLPEYNGMTMKSGTIRDVKGFCGYHKAKDGREYIFSFLVNNYNGSTTQLVNKMYKVLDALK
jgi:D-alanyl-D-alanine carboxypeptidase/D-alanyl-D-alanine-endopeptidase (penicillin-binding protein 4)